MRLILASGSATRAALLRQAGIPFEVNPATVDEPALRRDLEKAGARPGEIALALASAKAQAISALYPAALVLGADQILEFEGRVLGKSADLSAARVLLTAMAGKTHRLHSAAVLAKAGVVQQRVVAVPALTMRRFSAAFLDNYLADEGEGLLASVGCYRLEGRGLQLFAAIDGDYFAILGLPLLELLHSLRGFGILAG